MEYFENLPTYPDGIFLNFNPQVLINQGSEKGLPGIQVDLLY